MKVRWLVPMIALIPCAAPADEMCAHIEHFAREVADGQPHVVKLTTDWSLPDISRQCQHAPDAAPDIKLCRWLVDNTATEFMTLNIARVLECIGIYKAHNTFAKRSYIESLAGKVIANDFTAKDVSLDVAFDSGPQTGLPWLTITVTRHDKR